MSKINKFNIRVYGLIINPKKEILLSDEFRMGNYMTKFPGGGLQFGEGTIDCIKRECIEEFGQEVEVIKHFYTTDYFQPAYYFPDQQLISIYYFVRFVDQVWFHISEKPLDIASEEGQQSFRWSKIANLTEHDVSLPVDRKVVKLLRQNYDLNYF